MKFHFNNPWLLAVAAIMFSCSQDEPTDANKVIFTFDVATSSTQVSSGAPSAQALIVTVLDASNTATLLQQRIEFSQEGPMYKSAPLNLPPGAYTLAEFALVDENTNEIKYAVPTSSGIVTEFPLDISFTLPAGSPEMNVNLEPVSNRQAEEFGYSSFKLSKDRISIAAYAESSAVPESAEAYLIQNSDTVDHYQLKASANHIAVHGNRDEIYTLSVVKNGYETSTQSFSLDEIKGQPLKIFLRKESAFYMLAHVDGSSGYNDFQFDLEATGGTININWGDGTETTHTFEDGRAFLYHEFPSTGSYPVKISGDLQKITYFYSFYGQGQMDSVDFRPLTSIEEIRFGLTRSPKVLDLSNNKRLKQLHLSNLDNLQHLYLPESHSIEVILIDGPNGMSGAAVDAVIDNIYANTTKKKIVQGVFGLAAEWYQMEDDKRLVGPPSAASLAKLRTLKEAYGWVIYPDPF